MIEAGKLAHKVDIYGNKVKGVNAINQTTYTDGLLFSGIWAEIIPQTATLQRQQLETVLTHTTHKIIVRYAKRIHDAYQDGNQKNSMYIMYNGQRFDVTYMIDPYMRHESLEIFTKEVIG